MVWIVLTVALAAEPKLQLEPLGKGDAPATCACTVHDGKKLLFFHDAESEHPIVRLDGKKVSLDKGQDTTPQARPKVGDTFFKEFTAGDVSLRIDHTVTFVCPPEDASCEVAKFKATVTVKKGAATRVYKNLRAACGC